MSNSNDLSSNNPSRHDPSSDDLSSYDLIVIGTGGAAMAAGIEARERGKTVLLVEHNVLGTA